MNLNHQQLVHRYNKRAQRRKHVYLKSMGEYVSDQVRRVYLKIMAVIK